MTTENIVTSLSTVNCIMHTTLLHIPFNFADKMDQCSSSCMQWTQVEYRRVWAWRIGRASYWKWQDDPILQERASFQNMQKIVLNHKWLESVKYYTRFRWVTPCQTYTYLKTFKIRHTGLLEVFHNSLLAYVSKRVSLRYVCTPTTFTDYKLHWSAYYTCMFVEVACG